MSNVGPVCHIPPVSQEATPQPKNIPGLMGAPTDLQSALSAIRNLQEIIKYITGGTTIINNIGGSSSIKTQPGSFTQQSVETQKVKIYQNNDPTSDNWIEIEQINGLTMVNKIGETWKYNRNG